MSSSRRNSAMLAQATPYSMAKKKKSVVFPKNQPLRIIYEGEDLTPHPLGPLLCQDTGERSAMMSGMGMGIGMGMGMGMDSRGSVSSPSNTMSTFKTMSNRFKSEFKSELFKSAKTSTMAMTGTEMLTSFEEKPSSENMQPSIDIAEEREDFTKSMPDHVNLTLVETDTFFILDIPSTSALKDTPEGLAVEEENAKYDYLTIGKGRNRKVVNQEVQTTPIVLKSRDTQKQRPANVHHYAFASGWDMFDSYNDVPSAEKDSDESSDSYDDSEIEEIADETAKQTDSRGSSCEKQMIKLCQNPRFKDAVEIIQRLLANNNYNAQQKRFRGLSDPDPFRENVEYNYKMNLLWTFSNKSITNSLPVTCMVWSPYNPDILAVGYGKFYFTDKADGKVLLWNIKNPVQPEREYFFKVPVTSLDFSKLNPNLLGIGFYNGYIKIIDVSARHIRIICQTTKDTFPNFEAVWHLIFEKEENKNKEFVISFGQDGRIVRTGPIGAPAMISTQIMRIVKGEGKLKGLETIQKCRNPAVEVCRHPSCLVGIFHPTKNHIYLVGTNEGVVYLCSKHYFHQHLQAFLAHDGPIYCMKFSPFCNKLLMTCGDDWHVRIWCQRIDDPVLELKVDMVSVQSADWSPIHPTILASTSGKYVHIWDLQRKIYTSQSCTENPGSCLNTVVHFTIDGRCLSVGDIEGNVHIYSLEDMPFAPFFPVNLMTNALHRGLVSRPKLLHKILRVGELNSEADDKETDIQM